jgi:hypothetical protein
MITEHGKPLQAAATGDPIHLVLASMGYGDMIYHARSVALLARMTRGPISLETPPTLVRLMAYSFPNVVVTPTTSRSCLVEPQVVGGNAYLTADPARVAYYRNLVPANCIGLRWTSSCRRRVVPLLRLAPIYDRSPCSPTRANCMTLVATGA